MNNRSPSKQSHKGGSPVDKQTLISQRALERARVNEWNLQRVTNHEDDSSLTWFGASRILSISTSLLYADTELQTVADKTDRKEI